jgi:hypothetical protein
MENKLRITKVNINASKGDGNCFYWSILKFAPKLQNVHNARSLIANTIENCYSSDEILKVAIDYDMDCVKINNLQEYLKHIRTDGTYVGNGCVTAFEYYSNKHIKVYIKDQIKPPQVGDLVNVKEVDIPSLYYTDYGGYGHFDTISFEFSPDDISIIDESEKLALQLLAENYAEMEDRELAIQLERSINFESYL